MSASSGSWSQPVDPGRAAIAAAVAVAVFVSAWTLLHVGFYRHDQISDTPIYQRYGNGMAHGHVPYRDFQLEYPPAALPAFVIPSLLRSPGASRSAYRDAFEAEMLVCGAVMLAFMLSILVSLEAGLVRIGAALGFAALAPLALGSVVLTRFDLWPAALTTGAVAAFVAGRQRVGAGVLAVAAGAKLFPAVLVPIAAVWIWRRRGRREALVCLGVFAAVLAACFVPFLVLSPHGVWHAVTTQTSRPLQIESLGAGVLLVAHVVGGLGITMRPSHGSQNLAGGAPDVLAVLQTVLQAAALIATWAWFARGPATRERLVHASATAVCAFVVFGKVLSPQFLLWLVPLVPLVRGRRGVAAAGLLGLALLLTQLWFPYRYWALALHFDTAASWLVLVRDLVLVALFAVLGTVPKGLSLECGGKSHDGAWRAQGQSL
ncbi:MAG TPA: glycosyltransferase 87 family protein [Gaiellaceae bacterium]|nr:glycosyltransferase 87 family protein [Gaiellaceae bacterium]